MVGPLASKANEETNGVHGSGTPSVDDSSDTSDSEQSFNTSSSDSCSPHALNKGSPATNTSNSDSCSVQTMNNGSPATNMAPPEQRPPKHHSAFKTHVTGDPDENPSISSSIRQMMIKIRRQYLPTIVWPSVESAPADPDLEKGTSVEECKAAHKKSQRQLKLVICGLAFASIVWIVFCVQVDMKSLLVEASIGSVLISGLSTSLLSYNERNTAHELRLNDATKAKELREAEAIKAQDLRETEAKKTEDLRNEARKHRELEELEGRIRSLRENKRVRTFVRIAEIPHHETGYFFICHDDHQGLGADEELQSHHLGHKITVAQLKKHLIYRSKCTKPDRKYLRECFRRSVTMLGALGVAVRSVKDPSSARARMLSDDIFQRLGEYPKSVFHHPPDSAFQDSKSPTPEALKQGAIAHTMLLQFCCDARVDHKDFINFIELIEWLYPDLVEELAKRKTAASHATP
ncbi:hypothetical protein DFJ77DRAFT_257954 [Powellomyces hirtus]|nr:hypothetical protein DFJ77DRAFT_257954 [Powellomyces hirtus]